jgi:hypothetical protein
MTNYFLLLCFSLMGVSHATAQTVSISLSNQMDTICDNELLSYSVTVQNCPIINSVSWLINSALVNSNNSLVFDTTGFQQGDVLQVQVSCQVAIDSILVLTSSSNPILVNSFMQGRICILIQEPQFNFRQALQLAN